MNLTNIPAFECPVRTLVILGERTREFGVARALRTFWMVATVAIKKNNKNAAQRAHALYMGMPLEVNDDPLIMATLRHCYNVMRTP